MRPPSAPWLGGAKGAGLCVRRIVERRRVDERRFVVGFFRRAVDLRRRFVEFLFRLVLAFRRRVGFARRPPPPAGGAFTFTLTFVFDGVVRVVLLREVDRVREVRDAVERELERGAAAAVVGLRRRRRRVVVLRRLFFRDVLRRFLRGFVFRDVVFFRRRGFFFRDAAFLARRGFFLRVVFRFATGLTSLLGVARRAATRSTSTGLRMY